MASVCRDGADSYGPFNWGEAGVVASTYYDAILRHLFEWYTSGSMDNKSGRNHMAHIMASAAIVMDCEMKGVMEDDRPIGKTTAVVYSVKPLVSSQIKPNSRMDRVAAWLRTNAWVGRWNIEEDTYGAITIETEKDLSADSREDLLASIGVNSAFYEGVGFKRSH